MSEDLTSPTLDDALLSILVRHEERPFSADRATLELRCDACGRTFEAGFRFEHSPYAGQVGSPVYRTLDEALDACAALLDTREPSIDPEDWRSARQCECRAPFHLVRAVRARLVRAMHGAGAALVIEADRAGRSAKHVPHRGLPRPIEPTRDAIRSVLGRPLTLFDAWASVAPPGPAEHVAEDGVGLWVAPDEAALTDAIEPLSRARPLVVVRIDVPTVSSSRWPSSPLADHVSAGGAAALVVQRGVLHARLASLAAPWGGRIERSRPERFELRFGELVGLVYPHRVARAMALHGLTLADSVALAIDETLAGLERIDRFLANMRDARPGIAIAVDGGIGAVTRSDGSTGPPFALESLPVHLEPGSPELEREIRYLCDALPAWSDPTRVCTCGAPAWVQRRLLPFRAVASAIARPEHAPWILETWERDGEARAVDVVVVECDLHRRILPRRQLEAAGLAGDALPRRLARDRELARFALELEVVEDATGARAIVAHGPLSASALLEPSWLAGLNDHAGSPLRDRAAEAWAFAPDGVSLLEPAFAERDRLALVTRVRSGLPAEAPAPFSIRRPVELPGRPEGRFGPHSTAPRVLL